MTAHLTTQQLADITARADAATPGPWCTDDWEIYQGAEYEPGLSMWIGETCRGATTLEQDRADAEFVAAARSDVPALLAEVRRLKGQRKYLIAQLAKRDAETGRADQAVAEFLKGDAAEELPAEACGKCEEPFDPADTRHDGRAQQEGTPYCRRCVDRCHESTDAFHVCTICREGAQR